MIRLNRLIFKNFFEKKKGILKLLLGFPLTITAFVFIFKFIFASKEDVLPYLSTFNPWVFLLGTLLIGAFFLIRAYVWSELLKMNYAKSDFKTSAYLFTVAEIKRYIPGIFFAFVSRIHLFNGKNVTKKEVFKLLVVETLLVLISSAVVSIPAIFFFLKLTSTSALLVYVSKLKILAIALISIAAVIGLFYLLKKSIFKISWAFKLKYLSLIPVCVLGWGLFGLGNYLVTVSIFPLDANLVLQFSSFFVASWLAGYLFFVVPMGLGVREAVVTYGLSYFIPLPVAASIAIILRLAMVVSEVAVLGVVFFLNKLKNNFLIKKVSAQTFILSVAISSYITYFSYVSFEKHLNFFTGRFDLGNMDQTVWNTLNGRIFILTNPDNTNIMSRLGIHADFILILLSPFYLIWNDPRMLLFIQSFVLGFGALFVYLIAKKVLEDKNISLILAISFLLNPFVQKQNLYDFHAVTLSTTFLLAVFYFIITKKYVFSAFFLALSVLTKENVYLVSFFLSIFAYFKSKNKIWMFLSISSLILFYLLISKIIPLFRGSDHFALSYFQEFGDSPFEIIKNIIFDPLNTSLELFSWDRIYYLYQLFVPVGFLAVLSPLYLIFAIPDFAINLLSANANFRSLTFHYAATIVPFIYISTIYSINTLLKKNWKIFNKRFICFYLIFFAIFSTWSFGTLPGSNNPSIEIYANSVNNRNEIINYLKRIPESYSVASTNNLGAHLSHRRKIYTLPNGSGKADMILFLFESDKSTAKENLQYVDDLIDMNIYYLDYQRGNFFVYKKKL